MSGGQEVGVTVWKLLIGIQAMLGSTFNGAGGFYNSRILANRPFGLFGNRSVVRRQQLGQQGCFMNYVASLHWNSHAISCFVHILSWYVAFYRSAMLVVIPFLCDCNFLCIRLHAV